MAPFVEFDLAVIIHSTTESVRLYGTPVSIGGKTPNMLTVRSGRQTISCRGLAVPGARNTHTIDNPFLSIDMVKYAIRNLRDNGVIRSKKLAKSGFDHTNWYIFTEYGTNLMEGGADNA